MRCDVTARSSADHRIRYAVSLEARGNDSDSEMQRNVCIPPECRRFPGTSKGMHLARCRLHVKVNAVDAHANEQCGEADHQVMAFHARDNDLAENNDGKQAKALDNVLNREGASTQTGDRWHSLDDAHVKELAQHLDADGDAKEDTSHKILLDEKG